jgi:hypothetical protein
VIKRVLFAVVAVSALATAVGIVLVAGAFALFALLAPQLGEAGAAAVVAAVAAILVALAGLFAAVHAQGGPNHRHEEATLTERLVQMAKDRPMLAAGAALAAGIIALRNPQAAVSLATAFMAGKASDKTERRR